MSVEQNSAIDPQIEAGRTAYGSVIRERGTLKLVLGAIALAVFWYAASELRTYQLNQKQWQPLRPTAKGLTVLGLQTTDRAGKKAPYVARNSNKSWQIRYRDDNDPGDSPDDQTEEQRERTKDQGGNNPGATHSTNEGTVVPMEVLYKSCPTVMTGAQFASASLDDDIRPVFNDKYWKVIVDLTPEGQSRFYQYSSKHEKEQLAFILDDEVLACPRITAMNTNSLTLEPIWVKADAERIANFINQRKPQ